MKQSARSAVPRARWRSATLVPLLAAAALALGLLVAPAAVAAPAVPSLGSVRHVDVDVDAKGAAPLGLDLSGAGIRFTGTSAAKTTGTCLTDGLGRCDVDWASNGKVSGSGTADLRLPAGTYTVTQVADLALPGLQPKPGTLATVTICDCWKTFFGIRISEQTAGLEVANASLYRHTVTARVVDLATGEPVRDARYRLTGPGFPGLLGNPAVFDAGVERSNRSGQLSWSTLLRAQVYRPGTWTLTPVDVPAPYLSAPVSVVLTAEAPGGNTFDLGAVELALPAAPLPPETGSATLTLATSGPVPPGRDLSGAEFELVGTGTDAATAACVTDTTGSCSVEVVPVDGTTARRAEGTPATLPAGTYAVRQTSAPTGLLVADEIVPIELCVSRTADACATTRTVTNASTFRTRTEVRVLAGDDPTPGVELTLSGPGFEPAASTTDEDGRATWTGWFLPGTWSITVADQDEPLQVTLDHGDGEASDTWTMLLTFPAAEEPETSEGTGAAPSTTPAAPSSTPAAPSPTTPATPTGPSVPDAADASGSTSTPVPVPAAGLAGGPADQVRPGGTTVPVPVPGSSGRTGTGTATVRVVDPVEEAQEDTTTSTPSSPSAAPGAASSPAPPAGNGSVFAAADDPALDTESSSELLTAGLVTGLGILFLALVLTGYAVLRNRARRRV